LIENSKRCDEHAPAAHTGVLAPVTCSSSVFIWAMVDLKKKLVLGDRRSRIPLKRSKSQSPIQPFFSVTRAIPLVNPICSSLKRLLRRIVLSCTDKRKLEVSGAGNVTGRMKSYFIRICICICIWQGCSPETELNP